MNLVDCWRAYTDTKQLRPGTKADYWSVITQHAMHLLDVPVESWTQDQVLKLYKQTLVKTQAQANKLKRVLTAIWNFNKIMESDRFKGLENPWGVITALGVAKPLKRRNNRLYAHEYALFLQETNNMPRTEGAWLQLLLFTCLRATALASARWEWLDWSRGVLNVPEEIEKNGRNRIVALSEVPLNILRRLHARQRHPANGPIFPDLDMRCYEFIRARTGMDCRPHDLRRTHASIASELGYNEHVVKMVLGHVLSDVTGGYIHFSDSYLREVNRKVVSCVLNEVESTKAS